MAKYQVRFYIGAELSDATWETEAADVHAASQQVVQMLSGPNDGTFLFWFLSNDGQRYTSFRSTAVAGFDIQPKAIDVSEGSPS